MHLSVFRPLGLLLPLHALALTVAGVMTGDVLLAARVAFVHLRLRTWTAAPGAAPLPDASQGLWDRTSGEKGARFTSASSFFYWGDRLPGCRSRQYNSWGVAAPRDSKVFCTLLSADPYRQ